MIRSTSSCDLRDANRNDCVRQFADELGIVISNVKLPTNSSQLYKLKFLGAGTLFHSFPKQFGNAKQHGAISATRMPIIPDFD